MSDKLTLEELRKAVDCIKEGEYIPPFGGVFLHQEHIGALDAQSRELLERAEKAEARIKDLEEDIKYCDESEARKEKRFEAIRMKLRAHGTKWYERAEKAEDQRELWQQRAMKFLRESRSTADQEKILKQWEREDEL